MNPFPLLRRTAAPLAVAALMFPALAGAQCASDDRWERVELNFGSVPAPIVENAGQLGAEVAYAGLGASGTAVHFATDGGVDMVMIDDLARVTFTPENADGPPIFVPGTQLADVEIVGHSAGGTVLRSWGDVTLQELWAGTLGRHSVTGRTWRAVWSGAAADLDRIAFRVDGVAEITSDTHSGELRMISAFDPDHRLTLYPAKARVGDETTQIPFVATPEGVVSLGAPVPEGATIEMLLVFAPYSHEGAAVADGLGGIVGVGSTRDAVADAASASGRDIVVVRTDDTGRELLGMTVLVSSGDDVATGITAMAGETWITGAAGASDFPVAGKAKGATYPAAFAAKLDSAGSLVAGTRLRGYGIEAASDLALDAEGRLFVAGTATATAATTESIDLVAVLPVDAAAQTTAYTVAELSPDLDAAPRVQTFDAAPTPLPIEVRPGCDGVLVVGLATSDSMTATGCLPRHTKHTYTPVLPPDNLAWFLLDPEVNNANPPPLYDRWGYHALRWKEYYGNWLLPATPVVYDVATAASPSTPAVPIQQVKWLDHLRLDTLEANTLVFPNGDPAGTWLRNDSFDYLELAIGAAAYAEFWNSPTYANLRYDTGLPGGGFATGAVAITETQWCSHNREAGQGGPGGLGPVDLCRIEANCTGPSCRFPIDSWDDICAASPFYDPNASPSASAEVYLHRFIYSHWDFGGYNENETEIYWQDVRTRFDQATPNSLYVADPPTDVDRAESLIAEGVQRQLARVVEDVPVTITAIVGGQVASSSPGTGLVRAADRIAADL